MQDTPNFISYKNQFSQYTLSDLIDSRERVQDPTRSFIEETYQKIEDYFTDNDYRVTLGFNRKNAIEGQIANILSQFEQLRNWQVTGEQIVGANIQNLESNISAYRDEFDVRFTVPYQLYLLQQGHSVDNVINEIVTLRDEAKRSEQSTRTSLAKAGLIIGEGSVTKLSNFYQQLANGRNSVKQQEWLDKPHKNIPVKKISIIAAASSVVLYLLIFWLISIFRNIQLEVEVVVNVIISIGLPALVILIVLMMSWLNRHYPGGYARTAVLWMFGTILSTAVTAIYAAILVGELGGGSGWEQIIPKIIGLLAPAYLIRFCVQNYKANMHLSVQNTHRATLAQVTKGFSGLIESTNKAFEQDVLNGQTQVVHAAAQVMFTQSESGYITTKEGAGSGDNPLDGLKIKQ